MQSKIKPKLQKSQVFKIAQTAQTKFSRTIFFDDSIDEKNLKKVAESTKISYFPFPNNNSLEL
ncbi:MAG: hypothetical protein D6687_01450 [Acidobacteria bacterium]|nr:MAG: hypothetical protein D6687_01450 [Acidobacteriota bacterium]